MSLQEAKQLTDSYAREYANYTSSRLVGFINDIQTIGNAFESFDAIEETSRRAYFNDLLIHTLKKNEEIISAWTTWESRSIDNLDEQYKGQYGSTVIGNYAVLFYKQGNSIVLDSTQESNPDEVFAGEFYNIPKKRGKITIMEPYYYSYSKDGRNKVLETSVVVPVMHQQKFMGVVGLDVELETFKKVTDNIKPFQESFSFLVSNEGNLVTHNKKVFIGKNLAEIYPEIVEKYSLLENIQSGNTISFTEDIDKDGNLYYLSFVPVELGKSGTPWSLAIVAPLSNIYKEVNEKFLYTSIIAFISILILALVTRLISKSITNPLEKIDALLKKLNKANVEEIKQIAKTHKDEIGEIADSAFTLITWLNTTTNFAYSLKEGKLDYEYTIINDDDILGKSLLELQHTLKESKAGEDERRIENDRRNWATAGVAKFGEIARTTSDNMENFTYEVISNLVKYLNANQGGVFILNENEEDFHLELTAAFALNRKKALVKKIYPGEGLVGSCILEKKTIYLTQLPDDYIEITSGLGEANPSYLLIVPLLLNDAVYGALEIASFYPIEKYQVEFIEEIANIIASTVNNVRINEKTNKLLHESKFSSEQLQQQEEEMRQNFEELQTTQEELIRTKEATENKIKDVIAILEGLPYGLITTDESGTIIDYNATLLKTTGYQKGELDGDNISSLFKLIKAEKIQAGTQMKTEITTSENSSFEVTVLMNKIKKHDQV
ncbi:MAG: GAF domain-containing protein, partial [Bacteroidales bacterium]|nr:GAF domain-containing protein [Bacteroidales bacterium]